MNSINLKQAGIVGLQAVAASMVTYRILSKVFNTEENGISRKIMKVASAFIGTGAAFAYNGIYAREIQAGAVALFNTGAWCYMATTGVKIKNPDID